MTETIRQKYHPQKIRELTIAHFEAKAGNLDYDVKTAKKYAIAIEIKNANEFFFIESYPKGSLCLARGIYGSGIIEQKADALEKSKDFLGKVIVSKSGKKLYSFPEYEFFWLTISEGT